MDWPTAAIIISVAVPATIALVKYRPYRNGVKSGVSEELCEARRENICARMESLENTVEEGFKRTREDMQRLFDKLDHKADK